MATVSIEQDVVYIRDPAKSKEIQEAIAENKVAFSEIKSTTSQLTKEEREFIEKCFYNSKK